MVSSRAELVGASIRGRGTKHQAEGMKLLGREENTDQLISQPLSPNHNSEKVCALSISLSNQTGNPEF